MGEPVSSAWREQVLTRVDEQHAMLSWLLAAHDPPDEQAAVLADSVRQHLDAARGAVQEKGQARFGGMARASITGARLERASGHLDAVECDLLRLASNSFRRGQLPSLLAHVRRHLETADPRRVAIEQLALGTSSDPWQDTEREKMLSAVHAASSKARREVRQIRSFRNTLVATAIVLMIAAIAMAVVGWRSPASIPLCFHPADLVVCPTQATSVAQTTPANRLDDAEIDDVMRGTASPGDVALIELLGVMAAALSGALALRRVKGTSGPYSLQIALAVLKLPTGALTAVLAIVLMRGEFVPGLSALDSSAQILAWAIIFGYAQQLLTQLVDRQANTVLDNARSGGTAPAGTALAVIDGQPGSATGAGDTPAGDGGAGPAPAGRAANASDTSEPPAEEVADDREPGAGVARSEARAPTVEEDAQPPAGGGPAPGAEAEPRPPTQ